MLQLVGMFNGQCHVPPEPTIDVASLVAESQTEVDFGDIRGQEAAKRGVTIASAGGHNLLLLCPSEGHGSGSQGWTCCADFVAIGLIPSTPHVHGSLPHGHASYRR